MSLRLRVKSLRGNRIPETLNVGADDLRIPQWATGFQERAFAMGRWWGSFQLARFCINAGCIVLPREVATIEAVNLDNRRVMLSNMWGQFLRPHCDVGCSTGNNSVPLGMTLNNGCGCGCGCYPQTIEDRGNVVSMSTTVGTTQKIRTYCNAADNGKKITFQGYDSNGNWVRLPNADAEVIDGEEVVLSYPFVDTDTVWAAGAPTGVIKDTTLYNVLVYSYDTVSAEEVNLANYQPDETEPTYRMVSIPGFNGADCGCSTTGTRTLLAIVSLQSLPLVADNDWLLFQNLAAYKMGMLAEKYFEAGDIAQGDAYFYGVDRAPRNRRNVLSRTYGMGALPLLEAELRKMTGDITAADIEFSSVSLAGFL